MSWDRLWESIHGHLGVLAAIALAHPAIRMWRGTPLGRGARWSTALSTALVAGAYAFGLASYDEYRARVKRELFVIDPGAGMLFETKEHLAYATLAIALAAFGCTVLARAEGTRRLAARLYATAAALCLVVVALGTWVAAVRGF